MPRRVFVPARNLYLSAQYRAQFIELFSFAEGKIARAGKRYLDVGDDLRGAAPHDEHAISEVHQPQKLHRTSEISRATPAHHLDRKKYILKSRLPGQQGRILEYDTDFRARPAHVRAAGENRSLGDRFKAGNHHQQGAFAATARTEEADEFTLRHRERRGRDRLERGQPFAEDFAYPMAADFCPRAR